MSESIEEKLDEKLDEITKEMRERSHQLANVLQAHTADLAVFKLTSERLNELHRVMNGDPNRASDTGLKGAVAMLAAAVRDTEFQRGRDREAEERRATEMLDKLKEQEHKLAEVSSKFSQVMARRGGAFGMIREIGSTVTVIATAGVLIVAILELIHK